MKIRLNKSIFLLLELTDLSFQYKSGETLSLTCVATGYPKPTISWHKGSERLAITGETLTITNVTADNDGRYRCLADNQVHKPSHHHIYIQVERKYYFCLIKIY